MDYKKIDDIIFVRIDKDEEILDHIQQICKKENILSGYFQGIGACKEVIVSTYLSEKDDFIDHKKTGMLELVSLMGNISMDDNKSPLLHSHASFSYLNDANEPSIIAGHLTEATVRYTGEITIIPVQNKIGRMIDPLTGISVWDFDK
ncbi:PPC domain-containing DNA-binding protein [Marinilactibacillus psychrotolerans]|uniref:PPC domain-containing protein n=1 Tax=Marinilactibacillus psychrotolerans TaxID=191770 RepID=A0AAV3WXR6_9LACT|nr:DUF296 domain-containing protein [Marinilactibacillus psychrotolerans]GEL67464.1 hypothetical protein MPS01_16190 [Marinilactibacillus psychrotolerans]GEQ35624.1 hypothetical protein M132T_11320 [Marinilactibacillus psychrotolerans]SDC71077.1 hypothetical protein SAMN04488013_10876 [Marinilactibacillus psychrotolerans]